jgi:hypothetical protein
MDTARHVPGPPVGSDAGVANPEIVPAPAAEPTAASSDPWRRLRGDASRFEAAIDGRSRPGPPAQ